MNRLHKLFLLGCTLIMATASGMNNNGNDVYYVRFYHDSRTIIVRDRVTFPKILLEDMGLLYNMREDYGENLGSADNPFEIDTLSMEPETFEIITQLLQGVHNHIQNNPDNDTPEALQTFIWNRISPLPKHYEVLSMLLRYCDYLVVSNTITDALKLCLAMPLQAKKMDTGNPETLPLALQAGLSNVATILPFDTLFSIKSLIVKNIQKNAENLCVIGANHSAIKHPSTILAIPNSVNGIIRYVIAVSPDTAIVQTTTNQDNELTSNFIRLVFDKKGIVESSIKIDIPPYQFLSEFPYQNLIFENKTYAYFNLPTAPDRVNVLEKNTYTAYDTAYAIQNTEVDVTHIYCSAYKKWISIPNLVSHFSPFKDQYNRDKLICIVGYNAERQQIGMFDLASGEYTIIENSPHSIPQCTCTCNSFYIVVSKQENKVPVINLYNIEMSGENVSDVKPISIPLNFAELKDTKYKRIIATQSGNDAIHISVFGNEPSSKKCFIDSFIIDLKTADADIHVDRKSIRFCNLVTTTKKDDRGAMVMINTQHPDFNHLHYINCVWDQQGTQYIAGLDPRTLNIMVFEFLPHAALAMIDALEQLVNSCSLEQLYLLNDIFYKIAHNTFTKITNAEQPYFDFLKIHDKNLVLNIMDWRTHSIYKKPARNYTPPASVSDTKKRKSPEPSTEPAEEKDKTGAQPVKKQKKDDKAEDKG